MEIHDRKLKKLAAEVLKAKSRHQSGRLFTVAISGIDASGKEYITRLLQAAAEINGYKVANINIDPWQNPLSVRLKKEKTAKNIYSNIFRWNDFFQQLIFPLQKNKSIYLETKGIRTDADVYYPLVYDYTEIDILLLEGILLFKKEYLSYYDYKIWIDCSFETGMQRAIQRNAEQLDEQELISAYNTFYYPAQRLHLEADDPAKTADIIFTNE